MTIEKVTKLKIPTLLILLDSEKAFDRVENAFIWAVLERIGLGGTFLKLVQGLRMASSKVHVNGRFIEEVLLTRGVRQGCPLSPLLFALTTQPLMDYYSHKLGTGKLQGIKLSKKIIICHRRFDDDLGVNNRRELSEISGNHFSLQESFRCQDEYVQDSHHFVGPHQHPLVDT